MTRLSPRHLNAYLARPSGKPAFAQRDPPPSCAEAYRDGSFHRPSGQDQLVAFRPEGEHVLSCLLRPRLGLSVQQIHHLGGAPFHPCQTSSPLPALLYLAVAAPRGPPVSTNLLTSLNPVLLCLQPARLSSLPLLSFCPLPFVCSMYLPLSRVCFCGTWGRPGVSDGHEPAGPPSRAAGSVQAIFLLYQLPHRLLASCSRFGRSPTSAVGYSCRRQRPFHPQTAIDLPPKPPRPLSR